MLVFVGDINESGTLSVPDPGPDPDTSLGKARCLRLDVGDLAILEKRRLLVNEPECSVGAVVAFIDDSLDDNGSETSVIDD